MEEDEIDLYNVIEKHCEFVKDSSLNLDSNIEKI